MNHFTTSTGERVSKTVIDQRVHEAKRKKINEMIEEHGYIFCQDCGVNANSGLPLDCSHDKSVDWCQKNGRAELAWDVDNITIRCRKCHHAHDHKTTIKTNTNETTRERIRAGRNRLPVTRKFNIT